MADSETAGKTCFVIMPISDVDGYLPGHFQRVYDFIIKPACSKAGFDPIRADEVSQTNVIMIDVLNRTINSDMAVCDLSTRNPNVLFELGIRQAFNRPVTLIKDLATPRIFDIAGLRTLDYSQSLRVDEVEEACEQLADAIKHTATPKTGDVNSLIDILGFAPAKLPERVELSERDSVIVNALKDIADRVAAIEQNLSKTQLTYELASRLTASELTQFSPTGISYTWRPKEFKPALVPTVSLFSGIEWQVLRAMSRDQTDAQIAEELKITVNTVQKHISTIQAKLSVSSREAAITIAQRYGII